MVVILFALKKRLVAGVPEYRAMLARIEELVSDMQGFKSSEDFISEDGTRDLSSDNLEQPVFPRQTPAERTTIVAGGRNHHPVGFS